MATAVSDGTVVRFGDDGWGEIDDGSGHRVPFHCTAIWDGSRTIETGTPVHFRIRPGHHGRWEAAQVTPRSQPE